MQVLGIETSCDETGVALVDRERGLLKVKEQFKFKQMEYELVNANKVGEVKQQHDKQRNTLLAWFALISVEAHGAPTRKA